MCNKDKKNKDKNKDKNIRCNIYNVSNNFFQIVYNQFYGN